MKSCLNDKHQSFNPNRCAGRKGKSETWTVDYLKQMKSGVREDA